MGFVFQIDCNYFTSTAVASVFVESTDTAAESTFTESTATTVESELTSVDLFVPLPQDDNTAIDAIAKIANTFFMFFFLCFVY